MVHMKALTVPFQLSVSKHMNTYLKIDTKIQHLSAKILHCCGPRSPCLNSGYHNRILRYFWTNFKFMIRNLRLPNMSTAYPQKVSSEQPFPVAGRFWQPISAGPSTNTV